MKKEKYILFTAGRGPIECGIAVKGIQKRFKQYLESEKVDYTIINQKKGEASNTIESIVFKLEIKDRFDLNSWIGSIQWVCQSPIRKFHKRKNWFIKCEEIKIEQRKDLNMKDVVVQSYRASGPGGQHRNKVETAIRLIHKDSGIIVTSSDGKSQAQNKKKAWEKLHMKLEDQNKQLVKTIDASQWTKQIGIERGQAVKTFIGRKFVEK